MRNTASNNLNNTNTYLFFFNENNPHYGDNFNNYTNQQNSHKDTTTNKQITNANLNKNNFITYPSNNLSLRLTQENNSKKENFINKSSLSSNSLELNTKSPLDSHHLVNCRSVTEFEKIEEIGEGTYGRVCKLI